MKNKRTERERHTYNVENVIYVVLHLAFVQIHVLHHELVFVLLGRIVDEWLKENFKYKKRNSLEKS